MTRKPTALILLCMLIGCQRETAKDTLDDGPARSGVVAGTNATLWDGTGAPFRRGSTLVVAGERCAAMLGRDEWANQLARPRREIARAGRRAWANPRPHRPGFR